MCNLTAICLRKSGYKCKTSSAALLDIKGSKIPLKCFSLFHYGKKAINVVESLEELRETITESTSQERRTHR